MRFNPDHIEHGGALASLPGCTGIASSRVQTYSRVRAYAVKAIGRYKPFEGIGWKMEEAVWLLKPAHVTGPMGGPR